MRDFHEKFQLLQILYKWWQQDVPVTIVPKQDVSENKVIVDLSATSGLNSNLEQVPFSPEDASTDDVYTSNTGAVSLATDINWYLLQI